MLNYLHNPICPIQVSYSTRTKEADLLNIRQVENFSQNSWLGCDKNTNLSKYIVQCFRAYLGKMLFKKKKKKPYCITHMEPDSPLMGCSQHEVHTTLICTCRYATLQVFLGTFKCVLWLLNQNINPLRAGPGSSSYHPTVSSVAGVGRPSPLEWLQSK